MVPVVTIVEDDARIREVLRRRLSERGHIVRAMTSGMKALEQILGDPGDVVVLDLGLPDIEGGKLLKMIRAVSSVPIIVATARDEEAEIVRTLDTGADDYIVKPFSAEQLDARIRALLRRTGAGAPESPIVVGQLRIDSRARQVTLGGRPLDLTRKEFELLQYLAARAGKVVAKKELLAEVWQQPYGGADKTVDVHLSWLRRKLGETASSPRFVRIVRGVGVKLVDPEA